MSGTYLPPVVVNITATSARLLAGIAQDKALLLDFARTQTTALIGADDKPLLADIAAARMALLDFAKQVNNARLGATAKPFWTEIATLRSEIAAMSPLDVNVDANVTAALAQIAALRGALADSQTGSLLAGALGGAAGGEAGGGGILSLLGGLFGGGGGGGGGGASGLMRLLWGGGGAAGGLAGFGSLGSVLGFGAEGAGLAGAGVGLSGIEGLLGGGFVGLGAAGTMGVGMGTDMAGMGQAMNDVKLYRTALNALNTAIATFGKNSTQAAQAQAHLNAVLSTFPTQAQSSIVTFSNTLTQLGTAFNKATGAAEAGALKIFTSVVKAGEKFLPTIGTFATQNMAIIEKSLQPFLAWVDGPGLQIFTNLEKVFQIHLPTGMHAFEQGFELLARTITIGSKAFGPFLKWINAFLTRMNGATFGTWSHFVTTMIANFDAWVHLAVELAHVLLPFMESTAKGGARFVTMLAGVFKTLAGWLNQIKPLLHGLFTAHAEEYVQGLGAVIHAILPALEALAGAFLRVMTAGHQLGYEVLKTIAAMLTAANPVVISMAHALGTILGAAVKALAAVFKPLEPVLVQVAANLSGSLAKAVKTLTPALVQLIPPLAQILVAAIKLSAPLLELGANVLGGVLVVGAKVAAFFVTDLAKVLGDLASVVSTVFGFIVTAVDTIWRTAWSIVRSVALDAWHVLDTDIFHPLSTFFTSTLPGALGSAKTVWSSVWNGIKSVVLDVWHVLQPIFSAIEGAVKTITGGISGILGAVGSVVGGISGVLGSIGGGISGIIGGIAHLASGGLVERSTLALIGEGGPELVLPLNTKGRMAQLLGLPSGSIPGSVSTGGAVNALGGLGRSMGVGAVVNVTYGNIVVSGGTGTPAQIGTQVRKALTAHTQTLVARLKGGLVTP